MRCGTWRRHYAAVSGAVDCGKLLAEAQAKLDAATKSGETPLMMAADGGKIDFVKWLISAGCDPTIVDNPESKKTAYDMAKAKGHKEIAALLQPPGAGGGCCSVM